MFKVKDEASRAVLYIYGTIGEDFWDEEDSNRAKAFAKTLDELNPKPLDIRIDSAGGDVYEGFAIASAIQRYEGETHVYIDGMAASAASYIALMGDYITMNDYAMFMIHNAWTLAVGNRDELRETADRLEGIDSTIAGIISKRSGMELEEVKSAMGAETWFTADEALAAGMCNEVVETEQRVAASLDRAMAEHFTNIPAAVEIADEQGETAIEGEPAQEPEPSAEPAEAGESHPLDTLGVIEAKDAAGAFLLGNRVYRKENRNEDQ